LLAVVAVLAACCVLAGNPAKAETYASVLARVNDSLPQGIEMAADVEAAILLELNAYRVSKGRRALRLVEPDLVLAARAHALDLLTMGKVGHVASTGHSFESRMRAALGQSMLPAMAENVARDRKHGLDDARKAQALMGQWIDSPRHRKSLTDRSYVAVAIGAVRQGDHVYAVQIFSGPQVKTNFRLGTTNASQ
jgi:uncharacterized protein YkwD